MPWSNFRWPRNFGFPAIIQKVRTEGVLTPLLWLCGLSFVATLIAAAIPSPVMWVFAATSAASTAWVLRSFDYFRTKDPKLLQSEKFQLEWAKQQKILADRVAENVVVLDQDTVPNRHIDTIKPGERDE